MNETKSDGTGGSRERGENPSSLRSLRAPVQYFDFVMHCLALIDNQ